MMSDAFPVARRFAVEAVRELQYGAPSRSAVRVPCR
jgi:hypothetical protein